VYLLCGIVGFYGGFGNNELRNVDFVLEEVEDSVFHVAGCSFKKNSWDPLS
jgi:hypothetical protein